VRVTARKPLSEMTPREFDDYADGREAPERASVLEVDKLHLLTPARRNADAAELWAEAVRRFVGMTPLEMVELHERTAQHGLDGGDWLLLAVDALDQAGFDVQRLSLVAR
jgi:hypothetical protein